MRLLFTFLLVSIFTFSNAQMQFGNFRYKGPLNFNSIKSQADAFFADYTSAKTIKNTKAAEDNDYLRYKRWEWYWKDRVNEDGSFPDLNDQANKYFQLQNNFQSRNSAPAANWVNISQTSSTGGYNGMGRLTSIAFHPTDPSIFWVGAPIGGIWKTIDGGQTYAPLGDALPYCSVGNILVNHNNPDIIYISLGDHGGWWNYGLGIYKTTDGGLTWNPTNLTSNFSDGIAYYAMAMSPTNPSVIFVASTDGLYRTKNGGTTWNKVRVGSYTDVKYKPNDSTTVYACSDDYWGSSEVYRSTNGGTTFSAISSFGAQYNSIKLSVTPANPAILGIMLSGNGNKSFYKSSNSGNNINYVSAMPEDGTIFQSPIDSSIVYCGFTKVFQSTNGGTSWNQITNWYNDGVHTEVHADERFVAYNPLTNLIYFCNDGGVYNFDESANSWAELNNGLIITQFYSIALAQSDPIFMIGGTQDNGGRKRTGSNTWAATNGGDAMETAIDQTNTQIIYTTYVDGQLYRSLDRWTNDTYFDITPPNTSGNWITPYLLDNTNQSRILAGYEDVYQSINKGNTWTKLSNNLTGSASDKLDELEQSTANPAYIYAARSNKIFVSSNGGSTWNSYTLPFTATNFSNVSSIAIHPQNPAVVYVTVGGYSVAKKVFKSVNSGANWTNVSGTLPNIPVNASVFDENSSNNELYIGTDIGVFFINDTNSTWTYFGNNLPNTSITDLKIHNSTQKLRAATYGRGIWECDLVTVLTSNEEISKNIESNNFKAAYNPCGDLFLLNVYLNEQSNTTLQFFDLTGKNCKSVHKPLAKGNYQIPIDISDLAEGMYLLQITSDKLIKTIKFTHNK